jgi:hypothetical protein
VRLLGATFLPALIAALALAPAPASASCAAAVTWHGTTYAGVGMSVPAGKALSGGERPGCTDVVVNGQVTGDAAQPVALRRIKRLAPELGVVADDGYAYLALGTFPQLPGHPLHRQWRSSQPSPRCDAPRTVRGTALYAPFPGGPIALHTADGDLTVNVVASTRVTKLARRRGLPFVGAGTKLSAVVRDCLGSQVASRLRRG